MGDAIVGVYYRPLDQKEEVDETFYKQLKVALQSLALVLCWISVYLLDKQHHEVHTVQVAPAMH